VEADVSGAHTPGPWEACDPGDYADFDGNSRIICGDDRRIAVVHWNDRDKETDANSRLIAAAPNLLAALEALVRCFDIKDGISIRDEQALKYAAHVSALARGERLGA
jgi:hypothetical protein